MKLRFDFTKTDNTIISSNVVDIPTGGQLFNQIIRGYGARAYDIGQILRDNPTFNYAKIDIFNYNFQNKLVDGVFYFTAGDGVVYNIPIALGEIFITKAASPPNSIVCDFKYYKSATPNEVSIMTNTQYISNALTFAMGAYPVIGDMHIQVW